jgi:hypothetical protein
MTIDVPPELWRRSPAGCMRRGREAAAVTGRLGGAAPVGGPLQPGVDAFLDVLLTATAALTGELHWLGDTVAAVAASWLALDASQPAPTGIRTPQ